MKPECTAPCEDREDLARTRFMLNMAVVALVGAECPFAAGQSMCDDLHVDCTDGECYSHLVALQALSEGAERDRDLETAACMSCVLEALEELAEDPGPGREIDAALPVVVGVDLADGPDRTGWCREAQG